MEQISRDHERSSWVGVVNEHQFDKERLTGGVLGERPFEILEGGWSRREVKSVGRQRWWVSCRVRIEEPVIGRETGKDRADWNVVEIVLLGDGDGEVDGVGFCEGCGRQGSKEKQEKPGETHEGALLTRSSDVLVSRDLSRPALFFFMNL